MKKCLISFDLFRSSFGGLIHERLPVCISLNTNDVQKICSNVSITLKPDSALSTEFAISLSIADNDPGYHQTTLKNPLNVSSFHNDVLMWKHKFSIVLDVDKLVDSDNENVRDLNGNECRNDGLKPKSIEKCASRMARWSSTTADGGRQAH